MTGYDPLQDATHRAMAQAIDLANEARGCRPVQCAGCGRQYPTLEEAADCAYRHAYGERRGPWGAPRLSPAEARYLRLLEDNAGYSTDDEGDRVALARKLAAMPAPITVGEWEGIITRSIRGFMAGMESGGMSPNLHSAGMQEQLAQHLRGNLWAALQQRGVLP